MEKRQVHILIPARYQSVRLPGKLLMPIDETSIISRVVQNMTKSSFPSWVVADDLRIEEDVLKNHGKVIRVDDNVSSGSERIFLAASRQLNLKDDDVVVNVQGDEPFFKGLRVKELVDFHLNSEFDVVTYVHPKSTNDPGYKNPNSVKAVYEKNSGSCHYFSRASLPFVRESSQATWFHHIGVYSYKFGALKAFFEAKPSYYEKMEKLEQLRFLDLGLKIGALPCSDFNIGIDTREDLELARKYFEETK